MTSIVLDFAARGIINPPESILSAGLYEVLMGSRAFGTATPGSDHDVYGYFISKEITLPSSSDDNEGKLRVVNLTVNNQGLKQYDLVLYPVIKYFELCTRGYSQQLELLFAPDANLVSVCDATQLVRDNRHMFLHQGTVKEFCRFAHQQLDDMVHRRRTDGMRAQYIESYGFDVKAAYHVVRLMREAHQLHIEGDLDLQRCSGLLLSIRNGKWTEQEIVDCVQRLGSEIQQLRSRLPEQPDLDGIRRLFLNCIEAEGARLAFPVADLFSRTF